MKIYRVTTYYHLMLILLIVDKNEKNILYLDNELLFKLRKKIIATKIFQQVYNNKCFCKKYSYCRVVSTIIYAFLFKVISNMMIKQDILVTSQTNICGKLYYDFLGIKEVYVIEDGQYTYQKYVDKKDNSLYEKSILKGIFNTYFLTIYNPNIKKYFFRFPKKLNVELSREYDIIKSKIDCFNLEAKIKNISSELKLDIISIFFNNFNITKSNKKYLILLTQPYIEKNTLTSKEMLELYHNELKLYEKNEFIFFIKEHPRELGNKYISIIKDYNLNIIDKDLPFEFLALFGITFDVGITYNSTAIYSHLINKKIILEESNAK